MMLIVILTIGPGYLLDRHQSSMQFQRSPEGFPTLTLGSTLSSQIPSS